VELQSLRPGTVARFTLRLTNSGAGHKIPTGDPDRYFTVTFEVLDSAGKILKSQENTMRRWILWWPVIVELYENRLKPLDGRDYEFQYRLPNKLAGMRLRATVKYHIMTEAQYKRLQTKFGLSEDVTHVFTIFQEEVPLDAPSSVASAAENSEFTTCRDGRG